MNINDLSLFPLNTLSRVIKVEEKDMLEIMQNPEYSIFSIPKKSGGTRTIHAPTGKTKELQNKIYRNFLRKIYTGNSLSPHCFGGVPKKSTRSCIEAHSFLASNFVVEIDIKDAFHCVTEKSVALALRQLLYEEMFLYRFRYEKYLQVQQMKEMKEASAQVDDFDIFDPPTFKVFKEDQLYTDFLDREIHYVSDEFKMLRRNRQILFPNQVCKRFRSLIRNPSQTDFVYLICDRMADILAKLLTYKGRLVQGCPTSPILMALVLTHSGVIEKFKEFSMFDSYRYPSYPESFTGISVYVDNITLTVPRFCSKEQLSNELRELITCLHEETIWRFNWDKIHVYEVSKENPLVVGMRLVKHRRTRQELKSMTAARIKGARHALKAWEPWYYLRPTLPKEMQRKVRSAIHRAILDSDNDLRIQNIARGYIGYVFLVYKGDNKIPKQILKPLKKYLDKFGYGVLSPLFKESIVLR